MKFNIKEGIDFLERTPKLLKLLLRGLSEDWVHQNEGEHTWSPYDIIGHLIHGEKTDWIPRAKIILSEELDKTFKPFDRFAQFENSKGKGIEELLNEFQQLRNVNLFELQAMNINEQQFEQTGIHPEFGKVTLEQLLATWIVHDLSHINQISRVLAMRHKVEIGPWGQYIGFLNR